MNYPLAIDSTTETFERLKKYDLSVPAWKGSPVITYEFKVSSYSRYIVLRNDTMLFNGNLELLEGILKELN